MKALTLWQPWASLVARGVKSIETRSWSTSYRGSLAIHAAKREPEYMQIGEWSVGRLDPGAPRRMWSEFSPITDLPLGAVVATCTLVDVVPMVQRAWPQPVVENCLSVHPSDMEPRLVLWTAGNPHGRNVTDELPYGDFSPGRYAWLLADIEPLTEPIPAKGRQGLWEWKAA